MRKFFAVVKREYVQRLRSRMFILVTVLGPVVMSLFAVAPALIFSIRVGGPVRIVLVDQTGKLYQGIYDAVMDNAGVTDSTRDRMDANVVNKDASARFQQIGEGQQGRFELEEVRPGQSSLNEIKKELDARILAKQLDGYLILPANLLDDGTPEYFSRNTGDVFTSKFLQDALSRAVRERRLAEANIDASIVQDLSKPVQLDAMTVGAGAACAIQVRDFL